MSDKSLQSHWLDGGASIGIWCAIPSGVTAEVSARAGGDFVCLDMQHGMMGFDVSLQMLQAIDNTGVSPVVRVPWNDPAIIGKVLDAGAMTVIVPMTNTAEDAQKAVDACRYAPEGIRSFGPTRVSMREGPDYFAQSRDRVGVMPMIETVEALENLDAIAATPGISGLFFGPFDMSVSLGLAPGNNDGAAAFDSAIQRVLDACNRNNIVAGILANAELGALRVQQGFRFVAVSMDIMALAMALKGDLAKVRQDLDANSASLSSGSGGYGE